MSPAFRHAPHRQQTAKHTPLRRARSASTLHTASNDGPSPIAKCRWRVLCYPVPTEPGVYAYRRRKDRAGPGHDAAVSCALSWHRAGAWLPAPVARPNQPSFLLCLHLTIAPSRISSPPRAPHRLLQQTSPSRSSRTRRTSTLSTRWRYPRPCALTPRCRLFARFCRVVALRSFSLFLTFLYTHICTHLLPHTLARVAPPPCGHSAPGCCGLTPDRTPTRTRRRR